jgi:molybdopterin converting factor small subunit
MKITVRYLAQIKNAAETSSEVVEAAAGCTVRELVKMLAKKHGERLAEVLLAADGNPRPSILLFIGDRQVGAKEDVALQEGDEVTMLSPIGGG